MVSHLTEFEPKQPQLEPKPIIMMKMNYKEILDQIGSSSVALI